MVELCRCVGAVRDDELAVVLQRRGSHPDGNRAGVRVRGSPHSNRDENKVMAGKQERSCVSSSRSALRSFLSHCTPPIRSSRLASLGPSRTLSSLLIFSFP